VSHQLDLLLADLYPKVPVEPSTFGLTAGELRREANRLAADWSIDEIVSVLAVEPRCAP
jgi:hypothetical protein